VRGRGRGEEGRTIHTLALTLVVALGAVDEVFEVILWVFDATDLVFVVDEVAGERRG
jgi:hypothetical protein